MNRLIFTLLLFLSVNCYAKNDCVEVYEKNGAKTVITLNDASEITFSDNLIHIGTYDFLIANLIRYEFADSNNSGITEIEGDLSNLKIDTKGIIEFPMEVKEVAVYDLKGNRCHFIRNGNKIDFTNLPADIYLIKIGNSSFKLLKK